MLLLRWGVIALIAVILGVALLRGLHVPSIGPILIVVVVVGLMAAILIEQVTKRS